MSAKWNTHVVVRNTPPWDSSLEDCHGNDHHVRCQEFGAGQDDQGKTDGEDESFDQAEETRLYRRRQDNECPQSMKRADVRRLTLLDIAEGEPPMTASRRPPYLFVKHKSVDRNVQRECFLAIREENSAPYCL